MLRNRPSRVPLGMTDVKQMDQRLRLKQASHPLVAQADRTHVHHQQPHIRYPPQPHYNLREGPRRSRDASLVQLDSNRHVPQSAVHDSIDSIEDSDSDETASATIESVARLVHIAEVSPTITQVPGYDPPALVTLPSERSPIHDSHYPGAIRGNPRDLSTSPVPPRYRHHGRSIISPDTRSGHSYFRQDINHPYQRNSGHSGRYLSSRGHNPHAVAFAPRVRFDSALQELSPHHSSNLASLDRRGGTLRARRSSSRISNSSRGEPNHQTRSRPMSRSRGPMTRGPRRTGANLRPPAASSIDTVMDRYPIFPSMSSQPDPSRSDYLSFPQSESIPQRRGIPNSPSDLIVTRMPHPRFRFPSAAESYNSGRSRASSNSLSTTNMIAALDNASRHDSLGSKSWDERQGLRLGIVRSSCAGSSTSLLPGGNVSKRDGGLPPTHSPLDRLTQELQRLSTGLAAGSRSSSSFSRVASREGHLLSGNVFYSDNDDDETKERNAGICERPSRHDLSEVKGHNMDRQDHESSRQPQRPQRDLGITARIVDVEVDCQSATIRPLSVSPSSQSLSSTSRIDTSVMDSSPPGTLPAIPPVTPGRPQARYMRAPSTSCSNLRPLTTPRVRVYDDGQPASMQPQTPADLHHRFRTPIPTTSANPAVCQIARPFARIQPVEQSPPMTTRNAHRNTYPSFQQANPEPPASNSQPSSPYSPNLDLRTAAAITAVERRRIARAFSDENVIDTSINGMEAEREALLRRRGDDSTNILDETPPRQGRYERIIS
ncbi:uncharacterized protein M437DRAFT_62129 [Aureobasidium melanogenum CBS 110374]|uniref:Uncharacterized protein n=1 Tax=Aureobasidium melanogenum (strain CBS 110374) TaxID=1043003 RepID=A0A074WZC9_AURM1|nr:uncharacterized protein M437DRAFT_62129 [Aureobasidium melanogenum CBS 110374]KEQ67756.1 hypothetical protein M437DRAFT_62129 [Aureobasidium melanogenum CBS 110374]